MTDKKEIFRRNLSQTLLQEHGLSETHPCHLKEFYWNLDETRCKHIAKYLRQFVKLQDKLTLDIGCGTGMTSSELTKKGAEVVALDISKRRLRLTRLRFDLAETRAHLVLADAQYLPFKKCCFDIAICDNVIEHVPKQQTLAREISRILKDDGFLYLATPNKTSIRNIIRDPHYLLPAYDLLPRRFAKKYVAAIRKFPYPVDTIRLLLYNQLRRMFHEECIRLRMISPPTNFKLAVEKQIQTTRNSIKKAIIQILHWTATKIGMTSFILFYMDGWDFIGTKDYNNPYDRQLE